MRFGALQSCRKKIENAGWADLEGEEAAKSDGGLHDVRIVTRKERRR